MPTSAIPHVSPALARSARDHFQPLYAEPLTDDDGLDMATNVVGAFSLFKEWRDRRAAEGPASPIPIPSFKPKRRGSSQPSKE